jgi:hypothetical protein
MMGDSCLSNVLFVAAAITYLRIGSGVRASITIEIHFATHHFTADEPLG